MPKKKTKDGKDVFIEINKNGIKAIRIQKQTYVAFLHGGGPSTQKVSSRSLTKLKVPNYAYAFWFFDVTSVTLMYKNGKTKKCASEKTNESPTHYYGATLLTRADVIADKLMKKKAKKAVLDMMDQLKLKRVIRDRFNTIDPYHKDAKDIFVEIPK